MNRSSGSKLKQYLDIYWTMFKIGICTFGGGYAMMAIIEKELAEKKKWISSEDLLDYVAIGQITPGIIAVNIATFVGRKRKGIPGGIVSTLGVISPSVVIIMIIAAFLTNFQDNEYVQHALAGIRVCVGALILNATIGFIKKTVIDTLSLVLFLCIFILAVFTRIDTVYYVLGVIAISVVLTLILGERFYQPDRKKKDSGKSPDADQSGEDSGSPGETGQSGEKDSKNRTAGSESGHADGRPEQ